MQTLAIASNAFLEAIRQKVFAVLICVGILALVFNVNIAAYAFQDDNKLLVDLGLSTLFLVGLLLAGFTATGVLGREIEKKTILTVVSKPVGRPAVVAGKYVGVAGAIVLAFWILGIVFLLTVRHRVQSSIREGDVFDVPVITFSLSGGLGGLIVATLANYFYRRPFTSTLAASLGIGLTGSLLLVACIDRNWAAQHPLTDFDPQLLIAMGLVLEAVLVLTAIALAASTRLSQTATLLVCLGCFLCGLVNEYFLSAVFGPGNASMVAAIVMPNMQYFWMADALTQGHPITIGYFLTVSLYAGLMVVAIGSLAVLLFQHRDVG